MKNKQIVLAHRITSVARSGADIIFDFANGMRHTPIPVDSFFFGVPGVGDFLVHYENDVTKCLPADKFAALIGVSIETTTRIKTIARVSIIPTGPLTSEMNTVGTAAGGFSCSREWMERFAPELGDLVADTDCAPRYMTVHLMSRRSMHAVAGENTLGTLLAEMDDSGAYGWASRLRSLVSGELARRETFAVACINDLSPESLAVFKQHWESMRAGVAPTPVLVPGTPPLPAMAAVDRPISTLLEPLLAHLFECAALPRTDMLPTKVFKEALEAKVVARSYDVRPDGRTTVCELTALNGTTERGESSAVSASEFNKELGEKYAYEDALRKLWAKEGYLLRELHYRARRSAAI